MVGGSCAPGFTRGRDGFERNVAERGAVCVLGEDEPVVDRWGGVADAEVWH
jgi:hypothetical protein